MKTNPILEAVRPRINKITQTKVVFAVVESVLISGMVIAGVILTMLTSAFF